MKQTRNYPICVISEKGERALRMGHPWVYEAEVRSLTPETENGALVDIVSSKGRYLGTGFLSTHSKIRVRLISRNANDKFDASFWERRIRYAWAYRKTVMDAEDLDCCRIIFGEADEFPGLTVDRFHDILVTQTLSFGMEQLKPVIFPLLSKVLREDGQTIRGIYERNDVAIRKLEGLEEYKGFYDLPGEERPSRTVTRITENGVKYRVDFENGQKTGFFLDQKYNRRAVARIARGKRVLDCFTHTGSFALNAALGGAEHVHAVDISESAVQLARENAQLNGLEGKMDFTAANVFDLLPELERAGKRDYDFIILDPPDQHARHEAAPARGLPGHMLLLALYAGGTVCQNALFRRPGRSGGAQADRSAPAVARPPHPLERPGDELFKVLPVSGGVKSM